MATPEETAAALEKFLKQELALYREVLDLARNQKEYIIAANASALMQVISEKQYRINRIAEIEAEAAPHKRRREAELERWPQSARSRVDPLVRALQEVLGEIVTLEDESRAAAEGVVSTGREKVVKIQTGKAMLNAYGKSAKGLNISRYKDKNA